MLERVKNLFRRQRTDARRDYMEIDRLVEDMRRQMENAAIEHAKRNIRKDVAEVPDYYCQLPLEMKQTKDGWVCIHSEWKQRTLPRKSAGDALIEMWEYVKAVGDRQMEYAETIPALHDRRLETKQTEDEGDEGTVEG